MIYSASAILNLFARLYFIVVFPFKTDVISKWTFISHLTDTAISLSNIITRRLSKHVANSVMTPEFYEIKNEILIKIPIKTIKSDSI